MARFERIHQSVRATAHGDLLEQYVDPRTEPEPPPRPRPLAEVLPLVDAQHLEIDLYWDYLVPLRRWKEVNT